MNSNEFRQLIADREEWFRVTESNGFDFTPILSGLYSDSSHFVYEILQNAEDAKAESIMFRLYDDRLEIEHDGKPFSFRDVQSITSIGKSTKVEDLTSIGKFGVGFKSVYAITQSPTIKSGIFNFTIKNFVVPSINPVGQHHKHTTIVLPFDHFSKTPKRIYALVKNRLENLGLLTLLFLKNITHIVWQGGEYTRSATEKYKGIENARKVKLSAGKSSEEYLVFERPVKLSDKELRVEIAYKLMSPDGRDEKITHSTTSKLFVFLPTNEETYLQFLVQGPFRTTPARDNIPYENENNKFLIRETATLASSSLPLIRELGLLDISFLNVLPLKDLSVSDQKIYNAVASSVVQAFKSNQALIPSDRKSYCTTREALLARGKDLTNLLDSSDITELFERSEWVSSAITVDRTPEIRDFLMKKLDVPEVDFEAFGKSLSLNFLKNKDNAWFIKFYTLLKEHKSLWRAGSNWQQPGVFRTKAIIRLEDGNQIIPFDSNGNPQVYLPSNSKWKTHFQTVSREIVENDEALSFLKELGFSEPNLYTEVSQYLIPKYKNGEVAPASEEYFEDFLNLLIGFQEVRSDRKRQFLESIINLPFVLCNKLNSTEFLLGNASEIYFPTQELQQYFSGSGNALFVSDQLYVKFDRNEVDDFLGELGVSYLPRRLAIRNQLSWEEKYKLYAPIGHTRSISDVDYDLDGLENFFSHISKNNSRLLWDLLVKHIQTFGWPADNFFMGEYNWYYRTDRKEMFDAKFTKRLRETAWLYDQSNRLHNPASIQLSVLSPVYDIDSPASQVLIQQLQFKSDIHQQLLQQFPETERKTLEAFLSLSPEQRMQLLKDKNKHQSTETIEPDDEKWKPEVNPDLAAITVLQYSPPTLESNFHEQPKINNDGNKLGGDDKLPTESEPPLTKHAKEIGRWGEQYVFNALLEEYNTQNYHELPGSDSIVIDRYGKAVEITWLNFEKDRGRGCDFIISEDGEQKKYIEVKSTSDDELRLLSFTGTQWELARKLYDNNRGHQYWVYRVFNAGKNTARIVTIQNPIELWKSGRLYAHPVNVEI